MFSISTYGRVVKKQRYESERSEFDSDFRHCFGFSLGPHYGLTQTFCRRLCIDHIIGLYKVHKNGLLDGYYRRLKVV